jgi:hypothetical protein
MKEKQNTNSHTKTESDINRYCHKLFEYNFRIGTPKSSNLITLKIRNAVLIQFFFRVRIHESHSEDL